MLVRAPIQIHFVPSDLGGVLNECSLPCDTIFSAYDVPIIAEKCDWIGVMTYDLHTQGDGRTGLIAPFRAQPGDEGKYLEANVVGKRGSGHRDLCLNRA